MEIHRAQACCHPIHFFCFICWLRISEYMQSKRPKRKVGPLTVGYVQV